MKDKSKMLRSREAVKFLEENGIIFEPYNKGVQLNFPFKGVIYSWYPTTGKLLKEGKETIIPGKTVDTVYDWIDTHLLGGGQCTGVNTLEG